MKTKTTLTIFIIFLLGFSLNVFAQDFNYVSFGGHTAWVHDVAFSADGKTLASGSNDETFILWDVSTGTRLQWIGNFSSGGSARADVHGVAISPDGQIVASAGEAQYRDFWNTSWKVYTLRLWDVSTGEILWQANADEDVTFAVAFSPDGERVASGGDEHTIKLWDVSTGDKLRTLVGHSDVVSRVAFSADGQLLASASEDNTVRLWDPNTGRHLDTFARHSDAVYGVAISPDGLTVASGSGDGTVGLWDVTTGRHLHTLTGHEGWVGSVAISTDGQIVISGGEDGTIRLWEVSTGRHLRTLKAHGQAVDALAFSPIKQKFASGHADGGVLLWELPDTRVRIMPELVALPAVGKQFSIDINVAAGTDVGAYEVHLMFDTTSLRYVSATNGDYLPAGAYFIPPVVSDNTVILSATAITGTSNGDGKLATATFEVLDVQESFIDISHVKLTNSKKRELHVLAHSTKVDAYPLGDLNRDKTVNIQDLVIVAASFGQPVPEGGTPADVNGDGVVNIIDLVIVSSALGNSAAAPSALAQAQETALKRSDVQQWLSQAQQLNLTDATAQSGIRFLEQLLTVLTPNETLLLANYPNPFNPETWIPYQLAESADVSLTIHAVDGSVVRTLTLGHQPVGIYQDRDRAAYWDGRNAQGEAVASGVYFYTLTAGEFKSTRKMLIRK